MARLRFLFRQLTWDLGSGLLFRPALMIGLLALAAELVPLVEARSGGSAWLAPLILWLATEPASAQLVLATLAGSMMTVVSVVYSIVLVALSLASIQFSTRILTGLVRDASSQWTLGLFIGTFVYCLIVLRTVHVEPPSVSALGLAGAVLLAVGSLGALVWFIHHVIQSIQANHLVDRIATETERVIDAVFVDAPASGAPSAAATLPEPPPDARTIVSDRSGYIQLVDVEGLSALAALGIDLHVARGVGNFVAAGVPLLHIAPPSASTPAIAAQALAAFDIGPVRTMQQDVEYGFRQIVDIALKAVSPAVNDPSTAATCIDHLGRLLVRAVGRRAPSPVMLVGSSRVCLPVAAHGDLIDLSFEQLRQYGRGDMAVALRLMRAIADVASVTPDASVRQHLERHAERLDAAVRAAFSAEDCEELSRRRAAVARECAQPRGA